ncbi:hypothetical protein ACTL6P_24195 [Endozoicomonas acroporae]|uniref:hypothetical protein n=1 Tax=Endozoicomonas acroporae TaxID=1701104 RepID=UPI001C60D4CD|nr:hypothetical protein [Endozoicomonas acroporae]
MMTTKTELQRFPVAEYKDIGLPEYTENPLIAALPEILSPVDTVEKLTKRPIFHANEVNLEGHVRVHAIARLRRNFLFLRQRTWC